MATVVSTAAQESFQFVTYDNSNSSSTRKSNVSYTTCDFGLVLLQRLLISISIILGYDMVSAPLEIPHIFILHSIARILRNFFYITKGVRKWLAIHYNDGIIPDPPMRYGRSFCMARSTPRVSRMGTGLEHNSLKHSPIERRYSEPATNFDLATALKEQRNRSQGMDSKQRYPDFNNSSDLFGHSSLSFRFILNGLAQSFIGYIEDPDEEMNKKEAVLQSNNKDAASVYQMELPQQIQKEIVSENRRRAAEVAQSVLEYDAEQRENNSNEYSIQPFPIQPDFNASF